MKPKHIFSQTLRWTQGLADLVYPNNCLLCKKFFIPGGPNVHLCPSCENAIEPNRPPFCGKCSRHFVPAGEDQAEFCSECVEFNYHFDRAWGACLYNEPMRRLIHTFKYGNKTALRHHFTQWILTFLNNYQIDLTGFDLVTAIPLHALRRRERGYNQSEILARELGAALRIPCSFGNLVRVRHTQNQALIGRKDRWTNIRGAFRINHSFEFFEKSVLVVDDLMTTGTTLSEAAQVLKASGARTVGGLTPAIALYTQRK